MTQDDYAVSTASWMQKLSLIVALFLLYKTIYSLGKNQFIQFVGPNKSIDMDPESRKFTAFLDPWGFYEWVRITFSLMKAPACFQRFMVSCLGEYRDDLAIPNLDDLLVYWGRFEDHLKHVRLVLQRLRNMALSLRHLNVNYLKEKFLIFNL